MGELFLALQSSAMIDYQMQLPIVIRTFRSVKGLAAELIYFKTAYSHEFEKAVTKLGS